MFWEVSMTQTWSFCTCLDRVENLHIICLSRAVRHFGNLHMRTHSAAEGDEDVCADSGLMYAKVKQGLNRKQVERVAGSSETPSLFFSFDTGGLPTGGDACWMWEGGGGK